MKKTNLKYYIKNNINPVVSYICYTHKILWVICFLFVMKNKYAYNRDN